MQKCSKNLGHFFSFVSKAIRICMAVTCDKMWKEVCDNVWHCVIRGGAGMLEALTSVGMCKQRVCFCELVFTFYDNAEHTFVHFFDMCRVLNFLDGGQVQMCKVSTLNLRQVQTLRWKELLFSFTLFSVVTEKAAIPQRNSFCFFKLKKVLNSPIGSWRLNLCSTHM